MKNKSNEVKELLVNKVGSENKYINVYGESINLEVLNRYILGDASYISTQFKGVEPFIDLVVTAPPSYEEFLNNNLKSEHSFDKYKEYLRNIFKGVYNLCKPNSSMHIKFKNTTYMNKIIDILSNIGWVHLDSIVLNRKISQFYHTVYDINDSTEFLLYFIKEKNSDFTYNSKDICAVNPKQWWLRQPEAYSPNGISPSNIWEDTIPFQDNYEDDFLEDTLSEEDSNELQNLLVNLRPFSLELSARIIKLASNENGIIFDPFAGTGILLYAAEQLGRKYLGIDNSVKNKEFFENQSKEKVESEWEEIESYYKVHEFLKIDFKEKILDLRTLKFSKLMLDRLIDTGDTEIDNSIVCIYPIREEFDKFECSKKYCKGNFKIVVKDEVVKPKILNYIESIVNRIPFSKFSMDSTIDVISVADLIDIMKSSKKEYYLYDRRSFNTLTDKLDNTLNLNIFYHHLLALEENSIQDNPFIISSIKSDDETNQLLLSFTEFHYDKPSYKSILQRLKVNDIIL